MMDTAIRNFFNQFTYQPEVVYAERMVRNGKWVLVGMGGSHLAADIFLAAKPELDLLTHRSYGLPLIAPALLRDRVIILSSYSGSTEEVVDAFHEAGKRNLPRVVVAVGKQLIELAKKEGVPYVQLPDTGIQPRSALGYSSCALAAVLGDEEIVAGITKLIGFSAHSLEAEGKALAERIRGKIPVIYTSLRNTAIGYNWKIKLNETGKVPAFLNVIPELNHNEMTGFDLIDSNRKHYSNFSFLFLEDTDDHPQIRKRMYVTQQLLKDRGFSVEILPLIGVSVWERIFSSLVLADWTAYFTAIHFGAEPEQVPMVEEFKKLILL